MEKKKQVGRNKGLKKNEGGSRPDIRRQENAYGEKTPICVNIGCVMRKKAKCFGFEGCPGFREK